MKEQLQEIIKLSQNENPLGPSPMALKAVREYCDTMHRYPEPHSHSLKEKIADRLNLEQENVFVSAGLVESLDILIRNFVGPDGNMIIGEVTFVAYRLMAEVFGINLRFSKMKDHRMDVADILSRCDENTKLIIIANPNNPTGTTICENELIQLMENISPDTLVVIDEAYKEYVDQKDYPDSLTLWERYQNLIVMRTFSKIYGLAGLRVGYTIAVKDIIERMEYYQPPFTINRLGLIAAMAAIDDSNFVQESTRINAEGREFLTNALTDCGYTIPKSQSNFIFLSFPTTAERDNAFVLLDQKAIKVRKTDPFGDNRSFRITIGTEQHNRKVIECLNLVGTKH